MKNWEAPMQYTSCQGCIEPIKSMERWEVCDNAVVLANADYYYTKEQIDKKLSSVDGESIESLSKQVADNAKAILNRYTKSEVNSLLSAYKTKIEAARDMAQYAAIDGTTLSLNDKNITI